VAQIIELFVFLAVSAIVLIASYAVIVTILDILKLKG